MANTPFTIHPLTRQDYTEAFTLADTAYARFNSLLYKQNSYPPSRTSLEQQTQRRLATIATMPHGAMFKAVVDATSDGDDGNEKIIGVARWVVHEDDEVITDSVDEVVDELLGLCIPEMDEAITRGFYTMAVEGKRGVLRVGTPIPGGGSGGSGEGDVGKLRLRRRVELETIFVHPGYQRRGVASALLDWGVGEAERLGLLVYLEATEEGRPLYERFGFEVVREVDFDAGDFGGVGRHKYTFMVRRPRGERGQG
ncbi:GNAT family N-acetyltransferase [Aspergillus lucknowensis]|uniref:Acyl-CoA N-acyltransferase n=1 Tax=Aspergillus lucknowensis TaxID=176173 RepID=A0ABR4LLR1_9EURO